MIETFSTIASPGVAAAMPLPRCKFGPLGSLGWTFRSCVAAAPCNVHERGAAGGAARLQLRKRDHELGHDAQ